MDNISKQQFATSLKTELQKRNPNWNTKVEDVSKTNGVVLTTLVIVSNNNNILPRIYLEAFYEAYQAGYSLETIMGEIERLYEECNLDGTYFDIQQFFDFEEIRTRLCLKVLNAEKNMELLEQVPHRQFHDLAIVYFVLLPNEECLQGVASILVNNEMMEYWNISEDDMYKIAFENTKHYFNHVVRPIQEVIMEIIYKEPEVLLEMGMPNLYDEKIMYHVSSQSKLYGASVLLYHDLLEEFAREHGDFYILPSSVHELLFVPSSTAYLDEYGLCAMVQEINEDSLDAEMFLSNNIYLFHADTKSLEVITK